VHLSFLEAGADVIITSSYQATFEGFEKKGFSGEEAQQLFRLSVQLAQEARADFWANPENRQGRAKPLIAASIGCYGAYLADGSEYRGNYGLTEEELMAFHRPRMKFLSSCDPDIFACETIPCLVEARALVRLLKAEFPEAVAWLSFSCADERHLRTGEEFERCLEIVKQWSGIVAVGINCTSPNVIAPLLRSVSHMVDHKNLALLAYPNSGEKWDRENGCWTGGDDRNEAHQWEEYARLWYEAGARLIGGCCRTTPTHTRHIVKGCRNAIQQLTE